MSPVAIYGGSFHSSVKIISALSDFCGFRPYLAKHNLFKTMTNSVQIIFCKNYDILHFEFQNNFSGVLCVAFSILSTAFRTSSLFLGILAPVGLYCDKNVTNKFIVMLQKIETLTLNWAAKWWVIYYHCNFNCIHVRMYWSLSWWVKSRHGDCRYVWEPASVKPSQLVAVIERLMALDAQETCLDHGARIFCPLLTNKNHKMFIHFKNKQNNPCQQQKAAWIYMYI